MSQTQNPLKKSRKRKNKSKGQINCNISTSVHDSLPQSVTHKPNKTPSVTSVSSEVKTNKRPIGVFWDIENCCVPSGRSVIYLVRRLRHLIVEKFRECEFLVVCDTHKFNNDLLNDLNDCQVTVVHVNSIAKNAADDKLKQCIIRFVGVYGSKSALLIISGDINFATVLTDIRYRQSVYIILLHCHAAAALLACANETIDYAEFVKALPLRSKAIQQNPSFLLVTNLPGIKIKLRDIKKRLSRITNNCGGKVLWISDDRTASVIKFGSIHDAKRAHQRIDNEDVYGNKISVKLKHIDIETVVSSESACDSDSSGRAVQQKPDDTGPSEMPNHRRRNFSSVSAPKNRKRSDSYSLSRMEEYNQCQYGSSLDQMVPHRGSFLAHPAPQSNGLTDSTSPTSVKLIHNQSICNNDGKVFDLLITNLDENIKQNEWKRILSSKFHDCGINCIDIQIIGPQNVRMNDSVQFHVKAIVKLGSAFDVQLAVYNLQRLKIGNRKISISINEHQSRELIRKEVISLFQEIPHKKIPMIAFQELFEKKFNRPINFHSIYRLRDDGILNVSVEDPNNVCYGANGKYVMLRPNVQLNDGPLNYLPYCTEHYETNVTGAWAEIPDPFTALPYINISLKVLAPRIHHLLDTHGGVLPLQGMVNCYVKEFNESFDTVTPPLVSLEHLITCVAGVQISANSGFKRIHWLENNYAIIGEENESNPDYEVIQKQITQFTREIKELLRNKPLCMIPFNKLIPEYHTHFGRQCQVSNFGFVKLADLLEAIPNAVQIINESAGRIITLSHREQTKRFASDMLRVIKAQSGKTIKLSQYPLAYETIFGRPFNIASYGVCYFNDLLCEVWENTIIILPDGDDRILMIPKREQTKDEIINTQLFASEMTELLSTTPKFEINFNKVIPIYHHYYGKQCRLTDYGFTKLIELFEAISPETVEITGNGNPDDRLVRLNLEKRINAIGQRFERIFKLMESRCLPITQIISKYTEEFGYNINFNDFESHDLIDLIHKMPENWFNIIDENGVSCIELVNVDHLRLIALRTAKMLMEASEGEMKLHELEAQYQNMYHKSLGSVIFCDEFKNYFECNSENSLKLTQMMMFVRKCIISMQKHNRMGWYTLAELENLLHKYFNDVLPQPSNYKCKSYCELFRNLSDYFLIRKSRDAKQFTPIISLTEYFQKSPIIIRQSKVTVLKRSITRTIDSCNIKVVTSYHNSEKSLETPQKSLNVDLLLGEDIPKEVPEPQLAPIPSLDMNLINLSPPRSPMPAYNNDLYDDWSFLDETPQKSLRRMKVDVSPQSSSMMTPQSSEKNMSVNEERKRKAHSKRMGAHFNSSEV